MCLTPSCKIYFIFSFMLLTFCANASDESRNSSSATRKSINNSVPVRYIRYIFFFLSEDTSAPFFHDVILKQLIELDNYCSGENFATSFVFGNGSVISIDHHMLQTFKTSLFQGNEDIENDTLEEYLKASIAKNVSAGSIDSEDVNNVSATLLKFSPDVFWANKYYTARFTLQIILITNYVTESLISENTHLALATLEKKNVTFIALTANISDDRVNKYFRNNVWTIVNTNYTEWTQANETTNPICIDQQITTPNPSFSHGDAYLFIVLFFSSEYIKTTQLKDVIDLLTNMTVRRWLYPCEQYNSIRYIFSNPDNSLNDCCLEEINLDNNDDIGAPVICGEGGNFPPLICSYNSLNNIFGENSTNVWPVNETTACAINGIYDHLFTSFLSGKLSFVEYKYLLITDLPMLCSNQISPVLDFLTKYTDYTGGAPLTVIAIDKEQDDRVWKSYDKMFPTTQKPNLYKVTSVADLLPNITTTINFCLNFVPLLPQRNLPHYKVIWYYYVIGSLILIALITFFAILAIRRQSKRQDNLRQLREGRQTATILTSTTNYENVTIPLMPVDVWEIPLHSLDINFKQFIGKGAFSIVHSGFLHGSAPVLNIFPLIALQQFTDCDVAVKTVPQHGTEMAKTAFLSEVELMKKIGYHIHLVSMLGCNCSIERPILVMELAKQDLLHWLISNERETEINLGKTLISISWQISDGMIGDFGLCRKIEDKEQVIVDLGGKLPLKWLSLESLQEEKFSLKTDIWTFGILLFEIFTLGQEPYKDISTEELISFLLEGNRLSKPDNMDDEMYDLMRRCWQSDPSLRPDFFTIQAFFAAVLEDMTLKYGYFPTI